ncbi:MAG: SPOR domain-containing protein [Ignavibacteriaceae bacterium]|nr:SPOR domain-containing protein [Ignavibacteriaceae bacterium]
MCIRDRLYTDIESASKFEIIDIKKPDTSDRSLYFSGINRESGNQEELISNIEVKISRFVDDFSNSCKKISASKSNIQFVTNEKDFDSAGAGKIKIMISEDEMPGRKRDISSYFEADVESGFTKVNPVIDSLDDSTTDEAPALVSDFTQFAPPTYRTSDSNIVDDSEETPSISENKESATKNDDDPKLEDGVISEYPEVASFASENTGSQNQGNVYSESKNADPENHQAENSGQLPFETEELKFDFDDIPEIDDQLPPQLEEFVNSIENENIDQDNDEFTEEEKIKKPVPVNTTVESMHYFTDLTGRAIDTEDVSIPFEDDKGVKKEDQAKIDEASPVDEKPEPEFEEINDTDSFSFNFKETLDKKGEQKVDDPVEKSVQTPGTFDFDFPAVESEPVSDLPQEKVEPQSTYKKITVNTVEISEKPVIEVPENNTGSEAPVATGKGNYESTSTKTTEIERKRSRIGYVVVGIAAVILIFYLFKIPVPFLSGGKEPAVVKNNSLTIERSSAYSVTGTYQTTSENSLAVLPSGFSKTEGHFELNEDGKFIPVNFPKTNLTESAAVENNTVPEITQTAPERTEPAPRNQTEAKVIYVDTEVDRTQSGVVTEQFIYKHDNGYYVQVSSLKSRESAEQEANKFVKRGYRAMIMRVRNPGSSQNAGVWYRLKIGEFVTLDEAKEFKKNNVK